MCPDDKLLCWYRIQNQELVNSIVFFTHWSNMPVMLCIGYGIHPLFEEPVYTPSAHFTKRPIEDQERFQEQSIVEDHPINAMAYCPFSQDIEVYAPMHDGRGIYTLDGIILPQMDRIQTVRGAYLHHKEARTANAKRCKWKVDGFGMTSRTFLDMAIFTDDQDAYPACTARAADAVGLYEALCQKKPNSREYQEELQRWQQIQAALQDGGRDPYLTVLEARKEANLRAMKKKMKTGL